MWMEKCKDVDCFTTGLIKRNPGQPEFHQAVKEFVSTVMPFVREHPIYLKNQILEQKPFCNAHTRNIRSCRKDIGRIGIEKDTGQP